MATPDRAPHWRRLTIAFAGLLLVGVALLWMGFRPDQSIRVGTGMVAQTVCGDVFLTGLDPDRSFREDVEPQPGLRLLRRRLRVDVDSTAQRVTVSWAGRFARTAWFRPGAGCLLDEQAPAPVGRPPEIPVDEPPLTPGTPALQTALEHAFAEPALGPPRQVRGIVVLRDGHLVAERYALGMGPETPLLGYSTSKSVINALVGILVRRGRLEVGQRASIAAWDRDGDPRRAITLDQLLRMSSGLDFPEADSGLDPVSRMLFLTRDMAQLVEDAPLRALPGTTFEYTSGNTLLASRIVRDQVAALHEDLQTFLARELFIPARLHHATVELDGAGTPVGSTRIFASARDWARFGQLYLDDGVVAGQRILPEGWVAYSTRATLHADYGAGFWLNSTDSEDARWRVEHGMPRDAFYASGLFGQRVVVIPSEHLVIARYGSTIDPPNFDMRGLVQLVKEVIAAR